MFPMAFSILFWKKLQEVKNKRAVPAIYTKILKKNLEQGQL